MRIGAISCLIMLLAITACAGVPSTPLRVASPVAAVPTEAGSMAPADIDREVAALRAALVREVPQHSAGNPDDDLAWISRAKRVAAASGFVIDRTQLVVVVDRAPAIQQLRIIVARPDAVWQVIGGSKVSTGQAGRRGYFITPVGVFLHTDAILDFRALGTFNENHIRGLGLKGMRVWDFGWQTAERGWRADRDEAEIRLQMHATDPDYLEQRLGRPASEGCVRVPATMNRFLDRHGVLDVDYERDAPNDPRLASVLLRDRDPTPLAGHALIVVDSESSQ
jgi:hypothetical protein